MRVPLRWLKDYVELTVGAHELAELLTMTGTKVESVTKTAELLSGIISAKVLDIRPMGDDGRLRLAKLWTPQYSYTVVTAAGNVKAGDMVPLAAPGAVLADGKKIGVAEFSGVKSEGMMCSSMELGISDDAEGILILSDSCMPGLDLVSVLELQDEVLELEITPNRPDCLGILGVAREVSAITRTPMNFPALEHPSKGQDASLITSAEVLDGDLCPRYALKVFSDVRVGPSPIWMQTRLKAAGIRPISNIVDVTNYVMIDINQPLHAFDYDKLEGGRIIVRRALKGESITTLDGQERPVEEGMLLICDAKKPVAVAGVMGGAESEIGDGTKRVLLESANFQRQSVWRTSKSLKLRTESSSRFEKGLDIQTVPMALNRSSNLLAYMGAASVHPGIVDVNPNPWSGREIRTTRAWISKTLGTDLGRKIDNYLELIGLDVDAEEQGDGIAVGIPSWRADLSEPIDLAEEVARLHGYNNLESKVPANPKPSVWTDEQQGERRIKDTMCALGFHETMTYSMVPCDDPLKMLMRSDDPAFKPIVVSNPLSEDQSSMRSIVLPSLLRVASTNLRRGAKEIRLFEVAKVYLMPGGGLPKGELPRGAMPAVEKKAIACVMAGSSASKSWYGKETPVDFYDIKGVIESAFGYLGVEDYDIAASDAEYLRPGRRADVKIAGKKCGSFGQLHPDVAANFDLPENCYGFEMEFTPLQQAIRKEMKFAGIPKHPPTDRDIAMIVAKHVEAKSIEAAIRGIAGNLAEEITIFDIYEGGNIPEGMKSVAFTVKYRDVEKTLTSDEVNGIHEKVREGLAIKLGAVLR
ncbi:MAG: phenylalanine--tRNA ligase subunit beta [Firmicutes bacterium]|nr:phenylalanine--tRNA ligase subunit beta [Bacillota bacterium]